MSEVRGDDPTVVGTPSGGAPGSDPAGGDTGALAGRIAGRWEILALVGSGGMGNVYRARDLELGEEVALKVLRRGEGPGATEALERFRHEVKLARRVTHVNVARTHDIGRHGDALFLTMELIDGDPLTRRLGGEPLPWREAVAIARGVCAGVGAAHAAGVVHRDLKPDNVMLARDGRVVVTDFGIAAVHEVGAGADAQEVTGTPTWMAPEQLAGAADARADVYAIGEILWLMASGRHPWLDPDTGRVRVTARTTEPPPAFAAGGVPAPVAAVIARCLARDPAARWRDAGELGGALAEAELAVSAAGAPAAPAPARCARRDVAVGVEPIRNLGAADDEYVAAGLVEDLIDLLGRARGIRVRSLAATGTRADLDVVVGGSLRRAGDLVRIAVRVTGARDGFQIWSQRFDRPLDEILRVSDEVAREVAAALSATVASGVVGRDAATDQGVVELYLRARHLVESGWLDDPRPIALYQEALQRDPDAPVVLAAYATLLARRINAGDLDGARGADEARALVRRAIARGPALAEPWVALSVLLLNQGRNADAMRAVRIALDRGPGVAEANDAAGRMLLELDPALDEAVALLERARWANPRLPNNHVDTVRAYALRGDWERVDELLAQPGTESPQAQAVSRARMALWRRDRAPFAASAGVPGMQRFRWVTEVATGVVARGTMDADDLAAWRARLATLPPGSRIRRYFGQLGAELALRVDAHDAAWALVDDAVAEGLIDLVWLDRMPLLAPLRGGARFAAVRAVVEARGHEPLAVWRGPIPGDDVDAWGG